MSKTTSKEKKWTYYGKEMSQEEIVKKFTIDFLNKHIPKTKPSQSFSLFEMLLYPLIVKGLDKAKEAKMKDNRTTALYLLGYISARLNINALEDLFKGIEICKFRDIIDKKSF